MVTVRKPLKLAKKSGVTKKAPRSFDALAYLLDAGQRIPEEELARMPRDLAYNFDHHHDGSPKQA